MRAIRVVFGIVFVLGMWICVPTARTWYVNPDGTGDAPTIQDAFDLGVSGDTILLANGTFRGDGNRDIDHHGKSVVLRSEAQDPRKCIIDCEGSEADPRRGFYFHFDEGPGAILEGVTIKNAYAPLESRWVAEHTRGGKIHFEEWIMSVPTGWQEKRREEEDRRWSQRSHEAARQMIAQRGDSKSKKPPKITLRPWRSGGAIIYESLSENQVTLTIKNCVFEENYAYFGAAIGASGDLTISDCLFRSNSGAAVSASSGETTIADCRFSNNERGGQVSSAGISVYYCDLTVRKCMFSDNQGTALECCGFYGTMALDRCTFARNNGHGVRVDVRSAILEKCIFLDNSSCGVWSELVFDLVMVGCEFRNNKSYGVVLDESSAEIRDCMFQGHGLSGLFAFGCLDAFDCVFSKNITKYGAVNLGSWVRATFHGCEFTDNTGELGGGGLGIKTSSWAGGRNVELQDCIFANNSASKGGAIYCSSEYAGAPDWLRLSNCTFRANNADRGGAVFLNGLGVDSCIVADFANCTFYGNSATHGGGIFVEGSAFATLKTTIIGFSNEGEAVYCSGLDTPPPQLLCSDI
ncbi:MAG: right-handed parallel beta-helix repeat-containing protein [Candidatus Latescibacterota bacterium]|nr:MAG: right-handed parallel beta-helix repeat-containing protein [Candidatus Latescibacterota bacterium]